MKCQCAELAFEHNKEKNEEIQNKVFLDCFLNEIDRIKNWSALSFYLLQKLYSFTQKADELFIEWLKEKRKQWYNNTEEKCENMSEKTSASLATNSAIKNNIKIRSVSGGGNVNTLFTLKLVKQKVQEIIKQFGVEQIEKTCKWFLLWNNR